MQVVIHQGGPMFSNVPHELVPADLVQEDGALMLVRVRESPKAVAGISAGDTVRVLRTPSFEFPILVSDSYLRERRHSYILMPCGECGFAELFDLPSDLAAETFEGPAPSMFTTRCPLCGGGMVIRLLPEHPSMPRDAPASQVASAVQTVVASALQLDADKVAPNDLLTEKGADELDLINVVLALEDYFILRLPDELIGDYQSLSVASLVRILRVALADHVDDALLR